MIVVSVESNIFKDGFGDGVLDGHVHQLDVLGVGRTGRLNKDLPVARVRIPVPRYCSHKIRPKTDWNDL